MLTSQPLVVLVRLYVGLNVRICGSERDVVLTPLLPFSGSDDGPDATSPFYIDAIKTMCEHDKVLHVDCFYRFLHCCHMSNVPGVRIRIVEFYVWWTLPMPSYYHFVIPCLRLSFLPSHICRLPML